MISSIELAQEVELRPIRDIAADLDLDDNDFESYGEHTGKIRLSVLDRLVDRPDGKLILVTAMTPTPHGEGKTLTTIGLGQALQRLGKRGIIALREPSLGPVFGIKGGAAGGGYAQVLPMERINLHFNGDIHAITTAHNLLAAMLDNHLFNQGNELKIDVTSGLWNRAMDMNDRALRQIVGGLGGRVNGIPRESGFVITAASEVMAILALARSRTDLKYRLGEIVIGYNNQGAAVKAREIGAEKAMAVILNDAIMPNLVQTMEHSPAIVHAGPFGNIAHGTSSVLGTRIALKLADYVVTEAGFGADLGAEKFFDIVSRQAGFWPSATVVVATCRAIKYHGGVPASRLTEEDMTAFKKGLKNLERHIRNVQKFGVPVVVTVNRFPFDTPAELEAVGALCDSLGVAWAPHEAFARGGEGAVDLAEQVIAAASHRNGSKPHYLYELEAPIEEKIERIATEIYGAAEVYYDKQARTAIQKFTSLGYGNLPICVAKTQSSLSDDPKALGAPEGWKLTVTDVKLSAGAGFLVVICGNMMLMPGLPKHPAALDMDVDENGVISGLF